MEWSHWARWARELSKGGYCNKAIDICIALLGYCNQTTDISIAIMVQPWLVRCWPASWVDLIWTRGGQGVEIVGWWVQSYIWHLKSQKKIKKCRYVDILTLNWSLCAARWVPAKTALRVKGSGWSPSPTPKADLTVGRMLALVRNKVSIVCWLVTGLQRTNCSQYLWKPFPPRHLKVKLTETSPDPRMRFS